MLYDVKISPELLIQYPEIRLGCLRFHASVSASDPAFWRMLNEEILPGVRAEIEGKEWSEIPGVRGSRAAYKAFGRNPGRYRVSSEALLRRVRRGDELYRVNSVVDVNNLISVTSGMSVGSYDLGKLSGPVVLQKAAKGAGYPGIGKDFLDMENMLVLEDEAGLFGSSMSDSTRAMVTDGTTDVLVVAYCFEDAIDLAAVLREAARAFALYAHGEGIETWIV
ncbi:MAG: hypothetical protein HUJ67_05705 [Ruminiclostridium sp.]|nr:hypothetical protein [Ruminiclostridium sp.]